MIQIDQSPIGRTPRSNPATYTGLFTFIRELFAMLPEARARGFRPGRFSFNVKGGRCESCQGDGVIAIEMHFLPNVYVTCEQCKGRRYNRETHEIKYRGKSIADVLDLTVDQAVPLLENFPPIANKLRTLQDVGLGYIELGQSATTLSGGEAQRVKLAKELSRRGTGRTLYILDEPTTGLHFADTHKLLDVLNKLVDQGNTVVIIEHNLDVIKSADYVIDLGPEGGAAGGRIVAEGTPGGGRERRIVHGTVPRGLVRRLARRRLLPLIAESDDFVIRCCGIMATLTGLKAVADRPQPAASGASSHVASGCQHKQLQSFTRDLPITLVVAGPLLSWNWLTQLSERS